LKSWLNYLAALSKQAQRVVNRILLLLLTYNLIPFCTVVTILKMYETAFSYRTCKMGVICGVRFKSRPDLTNVFIVSFQSKNVIQSAQNLLPAIRSGDFISPQKLLAGDLYEN